MRISSFAYPYSSRPWQESCRFLEGTYHPYSQVERECYNIFPESDDGFVVLYSDCQILLTVARPRLIWF